jgi:hypothetical protein
VLPIPAAYYEREDTSSPTGVRLDFPDGVLPVNVDPTPIDPAWYNRRDGWSADAPILISFGSGVDVSNLPPITDPAASLDPGSPTVIIELDTGDRVPHFAEVDANSEIMQPGRADLQALIIRPVVRLRPSTTYAVAIRKSVKGKDGSDLPSTPAFRAMLDGTVLQDARLERLRPTYDQIFTRLEAAGVPRTELVVAWHFTTGTDEQVRADLLDARDAAMAAWGDDASNLTFTVTEDGPFGDPAETERRVMGTFQAPQLLTRGGDDTSLLNRGPDGKPAVVQGEYYDAPFSAIIPACAAANAPVPVVIYGHGLMGSLNESTGGYVRGFAQYACVIVLATEWRGMSSQDIDSVAFALNDLNRMPEVGEKLVQGIVNFMTLVQVARGPMAASATFLGDGPPGGTPLIDRDRVYYYGISQGGIYGATFMAYDPFVTRGVLGVPGANYSMMVERSSNWPTYYTILYGAYPNPLDDQVNLHLLQMHFDVTDPITTYPGLVGVNGTPIPGTPPKQVLLHMAIGDSQVPNISTETAARTAGLHVLAPAVYDTFGLVVEDGPLTSALTQWDERFEPDPPLTNSSLPDNGTHGSLRKRDAVKQQIVHFFETGEIVQTCGPDGAPAACDCASDEICGPTP